MSSSVVASNIPSSVSVDKVHHFFSFCGSVDSVTPKSEGEKVSSYTVKFVDPQAVSSALLLNGAELDGSPIAISSASSATAAPAAGAAQLKTAVISGITPDSTTAAAVANQPIIDSKGSKGSTTAPTSSATHGDISQEDKPKSTILAEYLSHGYVLGDNILQKAVEVDQKHGFSTNFKKFLSDLDNKYHVQEKAGEANKKYGIDEQLEKGKRSLDSYLDKASQTDTGSKIHSFYTDMVTNAKQIHEEAKRLADLKKQESSPSNNTTTTSSK